MNGKIIPFRGYGLENRLNVEHFMIGMPGTERLVYAKIASANRAENGEAC